MRVFSWVCAHGLVLMVAAISRPMDASRFYQFSATLETGQLVAGQIAAAADGTLEFVPLSGLFGRGVGTWQRTPSGLVEAALQVYMYTRNEQPEKSRKLLILCQETKDNGQELRGCVFAAEGDRDQVGTVRAVMLRGKQSCLPRTVQKVENPSHALLPPLADGHLCEGQVGPCDLERYRVGTLESVYYIPDVLTIGEEIAIEAQLAGSPAEMWADMAGRRVQECGTQLAADGSGLLLEELPPWMARVCNRLVELGVFPKSMPPNSIALNEYTDTEGIAAHSDGPIYAPRVAILSLFSPAILRFYGRQPELPMQTTWSEETDTPAHTPEGAPVECLLLKPRSLLLFCGQAYREHCHEVAPLVDGIEILGTEATGRLVNGVLAGAATGDVVQRGPRRISLTIRHVLEFLLAPHAFLPVRDGIGA